MHRITLYKNVIWNCINFCLFVLLLINGIFFYALSTDVCESDSVRIFKEKKMHVSVQNENILTRYILTYYKTRPNFFNIWRYTFGYYSY